MTQFHAGRVEGNCTCLFDNLLDLVFGDKQEFRFAVNKAGDEPGTGDPVNMNV
jgi:hypothetical protein